MLWAKHIPDKPEGGTYFSLDQECSSCDFKRKWYNQPKNGTIPEINLLLSAAILFCGALPGKIIRMFSILSIACICKDTFMRHQRNIWRPAVAVLWKKITRSICKMGSTTEPSFTCRGWWTGRYPRALCQVWIIYPDRSHQKLCDRHTTSAGTYLYANIFHIACVYEYWKYH